MAPSTQRARSLLCRPTQDVAWLPPSVPRGIECVPLGHINQVEQRAANARDGRDGVGRLLKGHRAGGDFVQAVINRTTLLHVGQWRVNRERALLARLAQALPAL